MSDSRSCPRCGSRVTNETPPGGCPSCLLEFGVSGYPAEEPTEPVDDLADQGDVTRAPAVAGRDYELLEEIARGGMGIVYRARQRSLNRIVAVKVILPGLWASAEQIQRFKTEAAAAARLDHPNIVPIYEVGELNGQPFFSMKLIAGETLARRILVQGDPLTSQAAASLMSKVARAVHYAHTRGILHRDLKPANILLDARDEPYLTDFGLAKLVEDESGLTRSAWLGGTPAYMAPELAAGGTRDATRATDVYGLGAILYELLTGTAPFQGTSQLEILRKVREGRLRPWQTINPAIPRDLRTVCLKCLYREPGERYATAEQLAEDLDRWLAGKPIVARPTPLPEQLWLWMRRNPVGAGLVGLLGLLVIVATTSAVRLHSQRNEARDNLWHSHLSEARSLRSVPEAGRRFVTLDILRKAAALRATPEVRDEAIACLGLLDLREVRRWPGFPTGTFRGAISGDHRFYARSVVGSGYISVRDMATHAERARLQGPEGLCDFLQFDSTGRYLAARHVFQEKGVKVCELRVWDWRYGHPALKLKIPCYQTVAFDFHPDGESVVAGTADRRLRVVNVASWEQSASWRVPARPAQVRFSPDGTRVAVGYNHGSGAEEDWNSRVEVFDPKAGNRVATFHHSGRVKTLAWHPAGDVLAVGCNDCQVYWNNVRTGKRDGILAGHENPVLSCAFSSDGKFMASHSFDGHLVIWDAGQKRAILSTEVPAAGLRFVSGSYELGFGVDGGEGIIWEVVPSAVCQTIPTGTGFCSGLDFSPDGRLVTLANPFGDLRLIDLHTGKPAASLNWPAIRSAWFSPDGAALFTSGHSGLLKWNVQQSPGNPGTVTLGPPERLPYPTHARLEHAVSSSDGSQVALSVDFKEVLVGRPGRPADQWRAFPIHGGGNLSLSRHGRWLASSPPPAAQVEVWDVATGHLVMSHPTIYGFALFSPDDRWLLGGADRDYFLWEAGSWRLHHEIESVRVEGVIGPADFSPDGRLLAVVVKGRLVRLLDPANGEELATLTQPTSSLVQWVKFSSNGRRLAVLTRAHGLYLWKLDLLRRELKPLKLDWRRPEYPDPDPEASPPQPPPELRVVFLPGSSPPVAPRESDPR